MTYSFLFCDLIYFNFEFEETFLEKGDDKNYFVVLIAE